MNDHTICAQDIRCVCGLTGYALRKVLTDPALSTKFHLIRGPKGGNGRRYWTLRTVLPLLRQKRFFTAAMETELAQIDLKRRSMGNGSHG